MKKLLLSLVVMAGLSGLAKASTIGDILNSFTNETHFSFLSRGFTAFGIDTNNGSNDMVTGTSIADSGPLSLDTGLVNPVESKGVGTPLIGVSLHLDRLINLIIPDATKTLTTIAPNTAQSFLSLLYVGAAPIYNFNTPANQNALKLEVYSGIELKFQ